MDAQAKEKITRRRFLSVCAMAGVYSALPWAGALASVPLHRWNGILLGANVSLSLAHPDRDKAHEIFETCVSEIKRLENIFTLYDNHSEISKLNADGALKSPSPEMVDILNQARLYHDMTGGAFDVTVKPLEERRSLDLVGMKKLHINTKQIEFEKPGMAITLNGIAQGYITDRITELLKAEGLTNVLVELGEKRTIGSHPSGRPWRLAWQGGAILISLIDKALATSASKNPGTGAHHIFTPENGEYAQIHDVVSVVANTAAMADALSTGFMSLDHKTIKSIASKSSDIAEVYF